MRNLFFALTMLAASAVGALADSPTATAQPESWRYVWNDGHWWYWMPEGRWVYWSNGCWKNYPGTASYVSAYPSSSQQPPVSAGPVAAGSIYSTSGYPTGAWSSGNQIQPFYDHAPSLFGPYVPPSPNTQIGPFYGNAFSQPYNGSGGGDQIGPFYGHAIPSYGW